MTIDRSARILPSRNHKRCQSETKQESKRLVGGRNGSPQFWCGFLEIQNAGHELAERAAQMPQNALLQRTVVLRAAEQIAQQLPKHRVALQKLHHARRDRAAEERPTIKSANNPRRKFQL